MYRLLCIVSLNKIFDIFVEWTFQIASLMRAKKIICIFNRWILWLHFSFKCYCICRIIWNILYHKNKGTRDHGILNDDEPVDWLLSRDNTVDDTWGFLGVSSPFEPLDQRDHSDALNCLRGEADRNTTAGWPSVVWAISQYGQWTRIN